MNFCLKQAIANCYEIQKIKVIQQKDIILGIFNFFIKVFILVPLYTLAYVTLFLRVHLVYKWYLNEYI